MADSDEDGLPEWVSQHSVSYLNLIRHSDSDEEIGQPSQAGPSRAHMHAYTGGPSSLPPADQPGISTQAPHATPKSYAKAAGPMQGGKQPQGRSPKQEEQVQQPGAMKARGGGGLLLSQVGQGSTPLATQHHELGAEAGASVLPTVAVVGSVPGTSGPLSAVPLMLPEKISKAKVLLELPARGRQGGGGEAVDSAIDLSGDTGAVGRILVTHAQGSDACSLRVDLKGTLYHSSVLPLAGTAMVVHISATEAKVETLVNDFIRLVEDEDAAAGEELQEGSLAGLFDADDENYQMTGGGGGAGEGDGSKPKKTRKKGAEGEGKAGSKPAKRLHSTKAGGVKKVGLKRAVGKGSGEGKRGGGAGKGKAKPQRKAK